MNSETPSPPVDPIEGIREAFWEPISAPLRRLGMVSILAACIAAARVARLGTFPMRLSAFAIVFATTYGLFAVYWNRRRQRGNPVRVLSQVVSAIDQQAGQKALRALRLREQARVDPSLGSAELADHFFAGVASRISLERIRESGQRRGAVFEVLVWLCLAVSGFFVFVFGHEVLEGFNVALALNARAPFPMSWLDVDAVTALPPAYLRSSEHSLLFGSEVIEPVGTVITIRGMPLRPNVELYLTNGQKFERFENNSEDELIAHFTIEKSERLRVAAKLGEVVVMQRDELIVDAEVDTAPRVSLRDANRTIRLSEAPRVDLFYEAEDDHGLRQIDIVLKSVEREERRPLMRLDGQIREQQGSHSLDAADPFFKSARLPVKVRIEARDDNNLVENNWGHSDWLTLEPENPGDAEVARLKELDGLRATLLDWYAAELRPAASGKPGPSDEPARAALNKLREVEARSNETSGYPHALALLLRAAREQLQTLSFHSPKARPVLEEAILTIDSAVHSLAERDATAVAQTLADLADEVARGAHQAISSEKKSSAVQRLDYAAAILAKGGVQLQQLGSLGADLGEIVRAALVRINRTRKGEDFTHVELTARYLAARLRRPMPSAAQSSGVEAGAGAGDGAARVPPSDANVRIERLLLELQQIRDEHKAGLDLLERELKGAEAGVQPEESRASAKERAERLRHLAERLPNRGAEPDSALSSQNVAREQAFGMAEAIERLSPDDTLIRGRAAHDAINEALVRGSKESEPGIDRKALQALRDEIDSQLQHAERVSERTKQKAAQSVSERLREQVGQERRLAERTQSLANRKNARDVAMPESMRDDLKRASGLMQQASESLDGKDGELAYDKEKSAQALLDKFTSKPNQGDDASNNGNHHGKPSPATDKGTVKSTGDPQAAAAFRRRVQQGLSGDVPGGLGSTIRRYAEGLLR